MSSSEEEHKSAQWLDSAIAQSFREENSKNHRAIEQLSY